MIRPDAPSVKQTHHEIPHENAPLGGEARTKLASLCARRPERNYRDDKEDFFLRIHPELHHGNGIFLMQRLPLLSTGMREREIQFPFSEYLRNLLQDFAIFFNQL